MSSYHISSDMKIPVNVNRLSEAEKQEEELKRPMCYSCFWAKIDDYAALLAHNETVFHRDQEYLCTICSNKFGSDEIMKDHKEKEHGVKGVSAGKKKAGLEVSAGKKKAGLEVSAGKKKAR